MPQNGCVRRFRWPGDGSLLQARRTASTAASSTGANQAEKESQRAHGWGHIADRAIVLLEPFRQGRSICFRG